MRTDAVSDIGCGRSDFSAIPHQAYNNACLTHLESLGLPLADRRVLELGSGPGDGTGFYLRRGCKIVSVDARQECIDLLKQRYPAASAELCDLNDPSPLAHLGEFEVIHCYGALDHVAEQSRLIRYIGAACTGLAVVSASVSPDGKQSLGEVNETEGDPNQSATRRGGMPTRRWLFEELRGCFAFVYQAQTQPNHPEFAIDWKDLTCASPRVRTVFVASKQPLDLPSLSPGLPDVQRRLDSGSYIGVLESMVVEFRAALEESEQTGRRLESIAAKRLTEIGDRDREINIREQRITRLKSMVTQPLAAMVDWDREINIREQRIAGLEATAAERLAAMLDRDREIDIREQRIAHLESIAGERLTGMQERDREIQIREQRLDHLVSIAAERLAAIIERDRELAACQQRISRLKSLPTDD
jgi:Methyltransferase domain